MFIWRLLLFQCGSMKFTDKKTIEIDRELSDLDNFAFDFIKIVTPPRHKWRGFPSRGENA